MNTSIRRKHSMDSLFMILLFGFFVLFLLLLLLFSAKAYQTAVNGTKENNELRTAMSYITTKVHQHDVSDEVYVSSIEDTTALCLRDKIEGKEYITYIFLDEENLKELFTSADTIPVKALGTAFCPMHSFEILFKEHNLYQLSLEDSSGHSSVLYLHPGVSEGGLK